MDINAGIIDQRLSGRTFVQNIVELFGQYGDHLLQRNIRCYLGLRNNGVNIAIQNTLLSDKVDSFYFFMLNISRIMTGKPPTTIWLYRKSLKLWKNHAAPVK